MRGKTFVDSVEFVTEECCHCGIPFAMTKDFQRRRIEDREWFYCPAGHRQHYTGPPETQRLREQLAAKQRQLEAESGRAAALEHQRDKISRSYHRMRDRVKNGVCPCCNRTFQNLLQHMKNQHPEFGNHQMLRALRDTYGLTQRALADEIGVHATVISHYEHNAKVSDRVEAKIRQWIDNNA